MGGGVGVAQVVAGVVVVATVAVAVSGSTVGEECNKCGSENIVKIEHHIPVRRSRNATLRC